MCGDPFGCGAKLDGCWCVQVQLPTEIAAALKTEFLDCVCPTCLHAVAAKPAMIVRYPNGATEIVAGAVRVDTQNFHEGMFDFYDSDGNLLTQISMSLDISWDDVG